MHEDRYYLKDRLALLRISRGAEILPRSTYHDRQRSVAKFMPSVGMQADPPPVQVPSPTG